MNAAEIRTQRGSPESSAEHGEGGHGEYYGDVWVLHFERIVVQLWLGVIDSCARQDASGTINDVTRVLYSRGRRSAWAAEYNESLCSRNINLMHI